MISQKEFNWVIGFLEEKITSTTNVDKKTRGLEVISLIKRIHVGNIDYYPDSNQLERLAVLKTKLDSLCKKFYGNSQTSVGFLEELKSKILKEYDEYSELLAKVNILSKQEKEFVKESFKAYRISELSKGELTYTKSLVLVKMDALFLQRAESSRSLERVVTVWMARLKFYEDILKDIRQAISSLNRQKYINKV